MQVLNLVRPKESDIKYEIIQFPDGEPHIVLNGIDRKDDLTVVCRVCNPTDLFILMQVGDILNRQGILFGLDIVYLMRKYRKELNEVIRGTLYNYVKDAFRIQLNKFTTDDIVSKRDSIENAIERYLTQALAKENFQLEQLTSGLKYPQTIVESVNAKNKAIQQAMQVENEVKVAEAQAKKLIVAAEAEKKANELRQQALTPAILEKMWIEKWDGKLPVYGQVPTIFKDISK
jgi:hypothetical protein